MTFFSLPFFYNESGDKMKVYVDLLLLFDFLIDYGLLLTVAFLLKRKANFYRLTIASFLGSLSVFLLFFPLSNELLFVFKILGSAMMVIVAFPSLSCFLQNWSYFYFVSIFLGGALYLWNTTFSFEGISSSFLPNSYQLNFLGLLLLSPIVIAYYIRKMKREEEQYSFYQKVVIHSPTFSFEGVGFLDSGNTLRWKRRPVILLPSKYVSSTQVLSYLPYKTVSGISLLKCFLVSEVILEKGTWKNVYVGILEDSISFDGVDVLLHRSMIGG